MTLSDSSFHHHHHHRRQASEAYTIHSSHSGNMSASSGSLKRPRRVLDCSDGLPVAVSPTTTAASMYWSAPVSYHRSSASTDAIRTSSQYPSSIYAPSDAGFAPPSSAPVSSPVRRSIDERRPRAAPPSVGTHPRHSFESTSTASRRISNPIFQAASNGLEPCHGSERDDTGASSSPPLVSAAHPAAGLATRRRLLSTAYEESESGGGIGGTAGGQTCPSTPRRSRHLEEPKSKFSMSPSPHRKNNEENETAFNRSLTALRKSYGDAARPDLRALHGDGPETRCESPLKMPRKFLGFLGSNSRSTSPLPPPLPQSSNNTSRSSIEHARAAPAAGVDTAPRSRLTL